MWQEFFLIPLGATTFAEAMKLGSETYHNLKSIIKKKYGTSDQESRTCGEGRKEGRKEHVRHFPQSDISGLDSTAVGDEGGFAPAVNDAEEAEQQTREQWNKS